MPGGRATGRSSTLFELRPAAPHGAAGFFRLCSGHGATHTEGSGGQSAARHLVRLQARRKAPLARRNLPGRDRGRGQASRDRRAQDPEGAAVQARGGAEGVAQPAVPARPIRPHIQRLVLRPFSWPNAAMASRIKDLPTPLPPDPTLHDVSRRGDMVWAMPSGSARHRWPCISASTHG